MKKLVSDELWREIEPLFPPQVRSLKGGRPPITHRQALTGIVFVLKTGLPWNMLPQELNCGSGPTCWRRFRDWTRSGLWTRMRLHTLQQLGLSGKLEPDHAVVDSANVRALKGGSHTGPNPTDRGKNGCKRHTIVDRGGQLGLSCVRPRFGATAPGRHDGAFARNSRDRGYVVGIVRYPRRADRAPGVLGDTR